MRYTVSFSRTRYDYAECVVEADTPEDAEARAMAQADSLVWSEGDEAHDLEVQEVQEAD